MQWFGYGLFVSPKASCLGGLVLVVVKLERAGALRGEA